MGPWLLLSLFLVNVKGVEGKTFIALTLSPSISGNAYVLLRSSSSTEF
jgi:hypothetical protein